MQRQRRNSRTYKRKTDLETKVLYVKSTKCGELYDDRIRLDLMKDRSCYFSPDLKDAGQFTDCGENSQQIDPTDKSIDMKELLRKLKDLLCSVKIPKDTNSSQYTLNISQSPTGKSKTFICPKNIYISDEPRIKIISEKFARYKKNNVEVRKLEERIVCLEYDVFRRGEEYRRKPIQTLRAYFSVTPASNVETDIPPASAKENHGITDEDLKNDIDKGIEIIDAKIPENKPYLEGLERVLKRKQSPQIKNKALHPMYLYQLANRDFENDYSCTDFLSKADMNEIKDLIMKKTTSSVYGINRRRFIPERDTSPTEEDGNKEKDTIIHDLFRYM